MRSSRNNEKTAGLQIESCNRLENAVKPQLQAVTGEDRLSCNRLENAVKPQPDISYKVFLGSFAGEFIIRIDTW